MWKKIDKYIIITLGTHQQVMIALLFSSITNIMPTKFQVTKNEHIHLGVKVQNMKMDFNTEGTWRRVGQWTLMMKFYDFFYSAKSLSSNKK